MFQAVTLVGPDGRVIIQVDDYQKRHPASGKRKRHKEAVQEDLQRMQRDRAKIVDAAITARSSGFLAYVEHSKPVEHAKAAPPRMQNPRMPRWWRLILARISGSTGAAHLVKAAVEPAS